MNRVRRMLEVAVYLAVLTGFGASGARATTFVLPCGTSRHVNLAQPRLAIFRIFNRGTCSAQIVGIDATAQVVLNFVVRPGECQDVDSHSVSVSSVDLQAGSELRGVSANLVAVGLLDGSGRRCPPMGSFACDGPNHAILQCADGAGCPTATYRVSNVGTCDVRVDRTLASGVLHSTTVVPGNTIDFIGVYAAVSVACVGQSGVIGCAFVYIRNP